MRVIVVAGGTGGHIYPAVAIINKIKEKEKNSEILYIGTTDRMEASLVPSMGILYKGIEIKGLDRKNLLNNREVYRVYKLLVRWVQVLSFLLSWPHFAAFCGLFWAKTPAS